MKLRIRGNSIRLRLSQQNVKEFGEKGYVQDAIQFGATTDQQLVYALKTAKVKKLQSEFKDNQITIFVPNELAKMWVESELVGMEHLEKTTDDNEIKILIEKDFKCMHVRINEDESDSFPHPDSLLE